MLIPIASLLAVVAFVVLSRLLWLNVRPGRATTLVTLVAAVLVLSLALLAATGRLSWLVAIAAAIAPFLRRALSLLRFLPWWRHLFNGFQRARQRGSSDSASSRAGTMNVAEACAILGLAANPSREEVVQAHRRLMQKLHPDRGGSTYLAQQLNEAKRVLMQNQP